MTTLECESEQAALKVLGYTQVSWDDPREQQPWSSIKYWSSMTFKEKAAARLLGYNNKNWDDKTQPKPDSYNKDWKHLTACKNGETTYLSPVFRPVSSAIPCINTVSCANATF